MSSDVDPTLWPFEAIIEHGNGSREYHQHARDNGDGTVTVNELHLPGGYIEQTYPRERVRLRERPWDKAQRWYELYKRVYGGSDGTNHSG